jgi:AAA family ATP:ADP antiporter
LVSDTTTASTRPPLARVVALCAFGFVVLAGYQGAYGSENEPWAWLGVAVVATIVVSLYAKFAAQMALSRLCAYAVLVSAGVLLLLLGALYLDVPGTPYLLYLWKDVYIVVLIELFWSIANSIFPLKTAKWLYGLLLVMGSMGAITGGRLAKYLAGTVGTEAALWAVIPLLLLCLALGRFVPYVGKSESTRADLWVGLRVLRKSQYLGLLLAIVAVIQVAITLIDYDFSVVVQATYPDDDMRTGVLSDVFSTINAVALVLQLGTGVLIALIGLRGALLGVPLVLGGCLVAFLVSPVFGVMMVAKVASKALDYSIFRAAKEMLYLPLTQPEKTQGKAVVDMLTYRVAKGGASIVLLVLKKLGAPLFMASGVALGMVGIWLVLTVVVVRRYHQGVSAPKAAPEALD